VGLLAREPMRKMLLAYKIGIQSQVILHVCMNAMPSKTGTSTR